MRGIVCVLVIILFTLITTSLYCATYTAQGTLQFMVGDPNYTSGTYNDYMQFVSSGLTWDQSGSKSFNYSVPNGGDISGYKYQGELQIKTPENKNVVVSVYRGTSGISTSQLSNRNLNITIGSQLLTISLDNTTPAVTSTISTGSTGALTLPVMIAFPAGTTMTGVAGLTSAQVVFKLSFV